jgi:hypothetical protein
MKVVSRRLDEKGNIILECEEVSKFLWIEKIKTIEYIATTEFPKGYWDWRELPDRTLVGDHMSFQLDSWNKDFLKDFLPEGKNNSTK